MIEINDNLTGLSEAVKLCYQCGTCAAKCPVFKRYLHFNPRKIVKKILLGELNERLFNEQQFWLCRMCYTCSACCPQRVDVGYVIGKLKKIVEETSAIQLGISFHRDKKITRKVS
jgi:heterodisulfide reductase subunit C